MKASKILATAIGIESVHYCGTGLASKNLDERIMLRNFYRVKSANNVAEESLRVILRRRVVVELRV